MKQADQVQIVPQRDLALEAQAVLVFVSDQLQENIG